MNTIVDKDVDANKQALLEYCKIAGISDYELYIDSSNIQDEVAARPEMSRLLRDAKDGKIERLVVPAVRSLFGANYMESLQILMRKALFVALDVNPEPGEPFSGVVMVCAAEETE